MRRSSDLTQGVIRRVGQAVVSLLAASALVWSLQSLAPGDSARRVLAAKGVAHPNAAQVAAQRHALGLDGNPVVRYSRWLAGAVRGDLGASWVTGRAVSGELGARLPATLILAIAAVGMSLVIALALGLAGAGAPGRWPDTLSRLVSMAALVLPSFLLGTALLHFVVLRWGLFQVVADGGWGTVFLPALTLSLGPAAVWSRVLRAELLTARGAAHIEVCKARGGGPLRLLVVHDLPNALVPFLTMVGVGAAALLGGAPIVETVFTWPGVGRFAVQAITARDVPVVQGFTLLATVAFIVMSMVADLAAMAVDPRLGPVSRPADRPGLRRRASVLA